MKICSKPRTYPPISDQVLSVLSSSGRHAIDAGSRPQRSRGAGPPAERPRPPAPERVEAALERMELVHVELEPGSAVFFHSNVLHRSDQNKSDDPRWAFICCYNAKRNDPFRTVRHPRYAPLDKWPDSQILEIGRAQWAGMQQNV